MFALGVHGYPLPSVSRVRDQHLTAVREAGAACVSVPMTAGERSAPQRWAHRLRDRIGRAELRLTHLVGPHSQLLAHDEARRRDAVTTVAAGIDAVKAAGAEMLFVGPGGFSDAGPWWWHPLNFAPASRHALVRSLRELSERAEQAGTVIVVEGYQGSVLESAEVMRDVIDAVGSPALGANLDYVNFLTPPAVARFPAALDAMAAALGTHLRSIHVKDARVWPRLSSHVEECAAGTGALDLTAVVELARAADVPAHVEHLRPPRPLDALAHVQSLARPADHMTKGS
jgi:sugar phosphate isomerase/epimerase